MVLSNCSGVCCSREGVTDQKENFRRLLRTVETLADLGPEMTAERDFSQTAQTMLSALMHAASAREGVLFVFVEKPAMLTSVAAQGFALIPEPSVIPLLPRHVHALGSTQGAVLLAKASYDNFLSANGNVAPELFKCVAPLRVSPPFDTSNTETLEFLNTAAATLPKFSVSPAMRSTPITTRSAPVALISCRIACSGVVLARNVVATSTS